MARSVTSSAFKTKQESIQKWVTKNNEMEQWIYNWPEKNKIIKIKIIKRVITCGH